MKSFKPLVLFLAVFALLLLPLATEATTYQWVDDGGGIHFTDNRDSIPLKFIKRAKEIDTGQGETGNAAAQTKESSPPPQAGSGAGGASRYGGRGENYWRSSFSSLRAEIKALEDGLATKKENLNTLRRKRVIYKRTRDRVAYSDLEQEIVRDEAALSGLQEKLKALAAEAENAAVPSEWRQ